MFIYNKQINSVLHPLQLQNILTKAILHNYSHVDNTHSSMSRYKYCENVKKKLKS